VANLDRRRNERKAKVREELSTAIAIRVRATGTNPRHLLVTVHHKLDVRWINLRLTQHYH